MLQLKQHLELQHTLGGISTTKQTLYLDALKKGFKLALGMEDDAVSRESCKQILGNHPEEEEQIRRSQTSPLRPNQHVIPAAVPQDVTITQT